LPIENIRLSKEGNGGDFKDICRFDIAGAQGRLGELLHLRLQPLVKEGLGFSIVGYYFSEALVRKIRRRSEKKVKIAKEKDQS